MWWINLFGAIDDNWGKKLWAHAGDLQRRFIEREGLQVISREDFLAWNIDFNQTNVLAVPLSWFNEAAEAIIQHRDDPIAGAMLQMKGLFGGVAGSDDTQAHALWGPWAPMPVALGTPGTFEKKLHMLVCWRTTHEIDEILRWIEWKGVDIHETNPKEQNRLMTRVQVIPTLLQIWGRFNQQLPDEDPTFKLWITPTQTLAEMIELNYFTGDTVQLFNEILMRTGGDLHLAFEEILEDVPPHFITPNCARVRKWLDETRPKIDGNFQPILTRKMWLDAIINWARKPKKVA